MQIKVLLVDCTFNKIWYQLVIVCSCLHLPTLFCYLVTYFLINWLCTLVGWVVLATCSFVEYICHDWASLAVMATCPDHIIFSKSSIIFIVLSTLSSSTYYILIISWCSSSLSNNFTYHSLGQFIIWVLISQAFSLKISKQYFKIRI